MRRVGLLLLCAACTGKEEGPNGNTSTADSDLCDGSGEASVSVGDVTNGIFSAWGPVLTYTSETDATGTDYFVDVGVSAANLALDGFATVHLVVMDGLELKIDAEVPAGVTCEEGTGLVGSMVIQWPWDTVVNHELTFEATITDDNDQSASGSATVTIGQ